MLQGLTDFPTVESLYLSMQLNHFQTHTRRSTAKHLLCHLNSIQEPISQWEFRDGMHLECFRVTNIFSTTKVHIKHTHTHDGAVIWDVQTETETSFGHKFTCYNLACNDHAAVQQQWHSCTNARLKHMIINNLSWSVLMKKLLLVNTKWGQTQS